MKIGAARGVAKVREVIAEEHREMQARAYKRVRPYLAGALARLRRAHPGFRTVVFDAAQSGFALVFVDGTLPREAPASFAGIKAACEELARMTEIEWLTAADPLWQVRQGTPQPTIVVYQYRYVESTDWQRDGRHLLQDARYFMRRAIYSRSVYGSHRAGFGKRIVDEEGAVVDEWVDPVEPMILRVLRESGSPVDLEPLCDKLDALAGFRDGFYYWDVFRSCTKLQERGLLRRVNPRAYDEESRFALTRKAQR